MSAESARHENMLSAMRAPANAIGRLQRIVDEKLVAGRAQLLSEWTDRDMLIDGRLYPAGKITISDVLDHAAHAAKKDR